MMESHISKCFEILRYSLNPDNNTPSDLTTMEWNYLFRFSCDQAIAGIVFHGIQQLVSYDIKPPQKLVFEWIAISEQIKASNIELNKRCLVVCNEFKQKGFDICVLKGQGNALKYPNKYSRMTGDIDIWVRTKSDGRCKKDDVIRYAKMQNPKAEVRVYHVEYDWKGVPVELHYMPGIMNNPIYNRRLQRWYNKKADEGFMMAELPDGVGEIPVPTEEFNIVFQLAHMMHHFFDEGIGLRQMIDYYYLLRNAKDDVRGKMSDVRETLKYLNLYKFAGAVMYIMKEVLGLDENYLIVPVDEKRGRTLLKEILKGGNFGQHSGLTHHSTGMKYFLKTKRNFKLAYEYPAEAFCEPFYRTWHFFWRMCYK